MEKVKLVEDKVIQETLEWAKGELEELNKRKRKLGIKAALIKEYLRTFINNPTVGNYVLMSCGRADEMKRKEETERQVESYSYKIPTWALSYLFNGDSSGLEERDLQAIQDFEKLVIEKYGSGHWSIEEEKSYFSHYNNVNDLAGDVYDCLYNIIK